LRRSSKVIEL